jgi:hypothetical protein
MIGLQPAVVCVTASGGGVQYFFQCFNFEKSEKKAREAGRKKYLITNLLSKEFDEIRYPNADTLGSAPLRVKRVGSAKNLPK